MGQQILALQDRLRPQQKGKREQVSTLLYSMGECADDIIVALSIKEETATYDEVKTVLDEHYEGRRNVIVDRA